MVVGSSTQTDEIVRELGLPCVLKQPDSAFSQGVFRADTREELAAGLERLAVAQRPRRRAGVHADGVRLARRRVRPAAAVRLPLLHGRRGTGRSITTARSARPRASPRRSPCSTRRARCSQLALKTANAIGDGFYGVDIKTVGGRHVLMEVNDNPNVDRGVEDAILGDELYDRIMKGHSRTRRCRQAIQTRRLSPSGRSDCSRLWARGRVHARRWRDASTSRRPRTGCSKPPPAS